MAHKIVRKEYVLVNYGPPSKATSNEIHERLGTKCACTDGYDSRVGIMLASGKYPSVSPSQVSNWIQGVQWNTLGPRGWIHRPHERASIAFGLCDHTKCFPELSYRSGYKERPYVYPLWSMLIRSSDRNPYDDERNRFRVSCLIHNPRSQMEPERLKDVNVHRPEELMQFQQASR